MQRRFFSTLLWISVVMVAPLAASGAQADIINWNLLYGDAVGGKPGRAPAPPRYTIVPAPIDGVDRIAGAKKHHRVYRHPAHWQIRGERPHRHPHEHDRPEFVYRAIDQQGRDGHAGGDD